MWQGNQIGFAERKPEPTKLSSPSQARFCLFFCDLSSTFPLPFFTSLFYPPTPLSMYVPVLTRIVFLLPPFCPPGVIRFHFFLQFCFPLCSGSVFLCWVDISRCCVLVTTTVVVAYVDISLSCNNTDWYVFYYLFPVSWSLITQKLISLAT